jgi:hypothetical protein
MDAQRICSVEDRDGLFIAVPRWPQVWRSITIPVGFRSRRDVCLVRAISTEWEGKSNDAANL